VLERALPGREVLAQRLYAHSQELADARRHLARYHTLVVALQERIATLAESLPDPEWVALRDFLERGLADVLATETADALTIMDDMLKIVSAQVIVRPSGHEFFVEGRDTLLQAGLKAGLKLNYGCGNGSCGLCKARVIAGEVVKVMNCDYPLSEAERLQGYTLLCAHSAGSGSIVIEALEAGKATEIPLQELSVRVHSVKPLAPDTLLLHLQTPRTSRLRFLAGQRVTVVGGDEDDGARSYPIASCPCDDRNLHLHIARDDADPFAVKLFGGGIRPGSTLALSGPVGTFTLADGERPLAFIACDTGFAPIKSLIEHALAVGATESISLDWLALRADGQYLANQCRAWEAAFDDFRYAAHSATDPAEGARGVVAALAAAVPLSARDVYVAGPEPFVSAALWALAESGAVPDRLFGENA
jgi:CDP-4-dehydro-6-deoxyglucose reductase